METESQEFDTSAPQARNPYESPFEDHDESYVPPMPTGFRFDWFYFPIIWAVLLFVTWTQHGILWQRGADIHLAVKIGTTVVTLASCVVLGLTMKGWRHLLAMPLWAYFVFIQYLVWTFYANR